MTALIFANDRWGSTGGTIDYAADALALFHTLRHKEDDNGGVVDGVTNIFDADHQPAARRPQRLGGGRDASLDGHAGLLHALGAGRRRSDLDGGGQHGRAFWQATPTPPPDSCRCARPRRHAAPRLGHLRAGGLPHADQRGDRSDLDRRVAWNVTESNQLLAFFSGSGDQHLRDLLSLDGTTVLNPSARAVAGRRQRHLGLGVHQHRSLELRERGLEHGPPTGDARYYSGILELVGCSSWAVSSSLLDRARPGPASAPARAAPWRRCRASRLRPPRRSPRRRPARRHPSARRP